MENFNQSSKEGQRMILTFFKQRMKEKKISQKELAKIVGISITSLWRIFKEQTSMDLLIFIQICGALELRPYLITSESDNTEMKRMFFN